MKGLIAKYSNGIGWRLHSAKKHIFYGIYQRRLRRLQQIANLGCQRLAHVLNNLQRGDLLGGESLIEAIETERELMLLSEEPLVDGTLGEGGIYDKGSSIQGACNISKGRRGATFLYLMAREFKPLVALELGTNVGIFRIPGGGAKTQRRRQATHLRVFTI